MLQADSNDTHLNSLSSDITMYSQPRGLISISYGLFCAVQSAGNTQHDADKRSNRDL